MDTEEHESAFADIERLVQLGDSVSASKAAGLLAAHAREPRVVARALILQIGQLLNSGHGEECPHLLDRGFAAASEVRDHSLLANLYALAAAVAIDDSFERCVRYLVSSGRELDLVEHPNKHTVGAGRDLAVTYSYTGFHDEATAAAGHTYAHGRAIGLDNGDHAMPEVCVRRAVWFDQRGDTVACVHALRHAIDTWLRRARETELWSVEWYYVSYAAARLAALGEPTTAAPSPPDTEVSGWEAADIRVLSAACTAIAEERPHDALRQLDTREISPHTLGPAESIRLRALACAAAGDYAGAWSAEREAARVIAAATDPLYRRLLESTRIQLDHEVLRRTVEHYASEAMTDSLTGLPNRRHFERWSEEIRELRIPSVVGMIDLDDFSLVNNVHGHLGGDLVLQRVAATLARTLREDDFIARHGGDEFVVVLPRTTIEAAREVGDRLTAAVEREDWEATVPGTPVSITVGWSVLGPAGDLSETLDRADRDMLALKKAPRSAPWPRRPETAR